MVRNIKMIKTERLILRPWVETDAEALYKYASDRRVSELALWPSHTSVEMSRAVIRDIFCPNPYCFAITLKESGEPIGCIGLVPQGAEHFTASHTEREIGYWIGFPFWNQGLVSEALKALVAYCSAMPDIASLLITTDARNIASQRVAGKCAFAQFSDYEYDGIRTLAFRRTLNSRCPWCGNDPLYIRYHDKEWGRPVTDDRTLFEFLVLESAQAGLAWITILRKREAYRKAFVDFDYTLVAAMTPDDEERLTHFDGIVRNRRKIHSAIVNARLFGRIVDEFGSFYNYIIGFFPCGKRIVNDVPSIESLPASSAISDAISKDMRHRGFTFFGTTICYAFLQATGFIDDHLNSCPSKSAQ